MPPKKDKNAKSTESLPPVEPEEQQQSPLPVWSVWENDKADLSDVVSHPGVEAITPTGNFEQDYAAFSTVLGLTAHPQLLQCPMPHARPTAPAEEGAEVVKDEIRVRNMVLDKGSAMAMMLACRGAETIKFLSFYNAGLSSTTIQAIVGLLPQTSVTSLSIEYNPMAPDEPDGVLSFAQVLRCEVLTAVSLRGNHLEPAAAPQLAEALAHSPRLQSLNLFDNYLGDEGVRVLAEKLRFNVALRSLSLSRNRIGDEGARSLFALFRSNPKTEEQVELRMSVANAISALNEQIEELNKTQKKNKKPPLSAIPLPRDEVDHGGGSGPEFAGNNTLLTLNLAANNFSSEALVDIAQGLAEGFSGENCALKEVAMAMNEPTPVSGDAVAAFKSSFQLGV